MKNIKFYRGLSVLILSGSILIFNGCSNTSEVENSTIKETEKVQDVETQDSFDVQQDFENENQLVEFFEKGKQKLYEIENSETTQTAKDTLYHFSVKIGDFILEGASIGGYTWNELSDATKAKILEISNQIDNLLIEYVPEQRGWLIEKWHKIESKASEITKDVIGEDNYEFWGNKKDEWIDQAQDLYEKGKAKAKDKYQDWKNNHE